MRNRQTKKGGVTFFVFSIILFTILKTSGFTTLSWWWVIAPFFVAGVFSFIYFYIDLFSE